jgi:molybdenum cofactor cytidylyltransferase
VNPPDKQQIVAIVLAAGASARMGRPKALLRVQGRTFVRRIIETLRAGGIDGIAVVLRPHHSEAAAEVVAGGGRVVVNPRADDGQLSSLIAGLDAVDAPGVDAVLVTLVDVPLIQPSTVRALLERAGRSSASVLRAVYRGAHGHPVIFTRGVFGALRAADPALGAKAVLRHVHVEDVEVDDPFVARDFDTPDEYEQLRANERSD